MIIPFFGQLAPLSGAFLPKNESDARYRDAGAR